MLPQRSTNIFTPKPLAWLLFLGVIFALAQPALAQDFGEQGLTISPFLLERKMDKGGSSDEIIDITNTSDRSLPVIISINDFQPIGENGQQMFFPAGEGDPHYSLSSWITIQSNPKPVLAPREKTSIHFTITAPPNAEEGGHYGAILFSFQSAAPQGTGAAIAQKLGAIILVKLGKAVEDGQISKFTAEHSVYENPPVTFVTRFKNTGNVHVKPRGSVSIYNMFGRKIATTLVNENANNVLAQTEREFKSLWKDRYAFGRYKAVANIVYGDSGAVDSAITYFWVLPWKAAVGFAAVLFIVIMLFVYALRRYNRWLLSKAYGQPRATKRTKK